MPARKATPAAEVVETVSLPNQEKAKNMTGTISADAGLLFPTTTRGRSNADADNRAQELLNDPSAFKVVYLTDDAGQPWDETTESGKKAVNSFRNSLANAVRKLSDGKYVLELRAIPPASQAKFAEAAGMENASHAYRATEKVTTQS